MYVCVCIYACIYNSHTRTRTRAHTHTQTQMADPHVTATSSGTLVRRERDRDLPPPDTPEGVVIGVLDAGGGGNVGDGGEKGRWWRDFFAARELWDAIDYDTWNGTYPHLGVSRT
jgi:hypothetical protein